MPYRNLSAAEIRLLEKQGCRAEDWRAVEVAPDFDPRCVQQTTFAGRVRLGTFDDWVDLHEGIRKPCGVYRSSLQDCTIGANCYIADVRSLARYDVADRVAIENVGCLTVTGETTFGNGVRIQVLNEAGGREKPLFRGITAQIAYLIVTYRHNHELIAKLYELVDQEVSATKSDRGAIGEGARITDCLTIRNVAIGPHATIMGALHLEEGTIASNEHDPVLIGQGVIAKKFIVLSGAHIDGAAIVDKCVVGQGVRIGKQFSAENSGFFANCECFHGEAVSVFAGPYTVTHHKSTLLIAGMFSFYNAGSGSNQSNHMYKLGPVHQGILGRGAKTGSFSYMMWPCRVGAFTGVIGKHYANFDTSEFPFSYMLEAEGKSLLMPAMNLCTVGTRRDSAKWPRRDRRRDPDKRDLINFALFSPYTVGRILVGMERLGELEAATPAEQPFAQYAGVHIKRAKIPPAIEQYEMAVHIYLGEELAKRLEAHRDARSYQELLAALHKPRPEAIGRWIDMAGMLAPRQAVEKLIAAVTAGQVRSLEELRTRLKALHEDYDGLAWGWCVDLIEKRLGTAFPRLSKAQLVDMLRKWQESVARFNALVLEDARKEFSERSRIGYGLDGSVDERDRDFEAVIGKYEENKFVKEVEAETATVQQRAAQLISFVEALPEADA
ncbi:MAG: DUF4954 family protein [bacterium]|jgi:hypothetical protein|nr:DUF4954 family protein [candidate division KSB1 bacterium]MDH7559797.1 DUF4954 family protein [bacterium]